MSPAPYVPNAPNAPGRLVRICRDADGGVRLRIAGSPAVPLVVQARESLACPAWLALAVVLPGEDGETDFADAEAEGHPARFYRIVEFAPEDPR